MQSLLVASLKFDFGILIGTQDDKVKVREKKKNQPRDNILFELGLFMGRLGHNKCAFIVDKDTKLPTDFAGTNLARFNVNDPRSFEDAVKEVSSSFTLNSLPEVNFFPSVSIAAAYFKNFIFPFYDYLEKNRGHSFNGKHYSNAKFYIVIPERINEDVNDLFDEIKSNFSFKIQDFPYKTRKRVVNLNTNIKGNCLEFVDFPTNIEGIHHAISLLLPAEFINRSDDYKLILEREVNRFIVILQKMCKDFGFPSINFVKFSKKKRKFIPYF